MEIKFDTTIAETLHQLPRIAKILGVEQSKLGVVDEPERYHMQHEDHRDTVISTHGFRDDLPFVQYEPGLHHDSHRVNLGYGVAIYETGTDDELEKPLRYAIVNVPSEVEQDVENYMVAVADDIKLITEYWGRIQYEEEVVEVTPPILEDNFLQDVIDASVGFLMKRDEIAKYRVRLRRGILLDGDPGNGKTMTMRYIRQKCQEANIRSKNITATELMMAFRDNQLEAFMSCAPVMFFDDIDTSFFNRNRTDGGDGRMCCALLSAMDGMNEGQHCIRIFSTNEQIKDMDPAFKRPGRIDRVFHFDDPTPILRRRLIKTWHEEILEGVGVEDVVARTNGFSFAETDSIRDLLVTNKIFGDKTWNLDAAIEMFEDTQAAREEVDKMYEENGEERPKSSADVDTDIVEAVEPPEVATQGT